MTDNKEPKKNNENGHEADTGAEQDDKIADDAKGSPEIKEEVDFEDKYKRALADYQNLLKQNAREKQDFLKYANEQLLHDFLPVYDNLKTALKHSDGMAEDDPWVTGVRYVLRQFAEALKHHGVEEIEVVGKKFDHDCMEAVSGNGEIVSKELRPGYKLNGKTIVPAKVALGEEEK